MKNRLNRIYDCMKSRCCNPNVPNYKYYGGRGISICSEWLNEEKVIKGKYIHNHSKGWLAFKKWALENGYADNLTLDRIDVNKSYSPGNCRWISHKEQCNNTRKNHLITYKGKTQSLKKWCEELNLNYHTVFTRVRRGWTVERAFEDSSKF